MKPKFRCCCMYRTDSFADMLNHVTTCTLALGEKMNTMPPQLPKVCVSKDCYNLVDDRELDYCYKCMEEHSKALYEKMCAPDPFDPSHNPSHYHEGRGIDPIGVMKETFTAAEYEGFLKGNALKYVMRYQSKNGVQDLRKAIDYIQRIIDFYEK